MRGIEIAEFGAAEVLHYGELQDPTPESDQVLIEVRGASVNYADIKARSGSYHLGKAPPFCPGLDVAGVVREVGSEVKTIQPGDHVIAFPAAGSYVEFAVAAETLTYVIPTTVDFVHAVAAGLAAGTVTHMLTNLARVRKEESLLVHAAGGGVGTMALQVARALGLTHIYGSIGSPWKEAHVREQGALEVIDYRSETYARDLVRMTADRGVDVILNPLGGASVEQDLECLAPFGRLLIFGELLGGRSKIAQDGLYPANKSILGSSFGHYRRHRPILVRETMARVIDLLVNKKIEIEVSSCLPLSQAAEAHRLLEDRKSVGRVVLVPDQFWKQGA